MIQDTKNFGGRDLKEPSRGFFVRGGARGVGSGGRQKRAHRKGRDMILEGKEGYDMRWHRLAMDFFYFLHSSFLLSVFLKKKKKKKKKKNRISSEFT